MDSNRDELILDIAAEGFWDWDLVTDRAYLSPRYCELTGYFPEETVFDSQFFRSIIHPDDRDRVFSVIDDYLHGRREDSLVEYRMISRDGTLRWIEGKGRIVAYDGEGRPLRVVGTVSDITARKEIEQRLRTSEELFSDAFRLSPDAVNINRLSDGVYIEVNEGFTEITGYRPEEVIGRSSLELNIWNDPDDRARMVRELAEHGIVNNLEARFRARDGSLLTGYMSARVIDVGGTPCVLSITRNMTEHKRAEAAVRASDRHYQRMTATVPLMLYDYVMQPDGMSRFTYVSPNCRAILELEEPELLADMDLFWNMVHPDDIQRLRGEDAAANIQGESFASDVRVITRSGVQKWIQIASRPSPVQEGGLLIWSGYMLDVTERRQAGERLRESEERHRMILQTAMDGFWLLDTRERLLDVNEAYCAMSGYSAAELRTMRVHDLVVDETDASIPARTDRLMEEGQDRFESRHRRKDGSIFDVEVSVKFADIEGGRCVAFLRDITERKLAEQELRKKNADIEQFIYTVSHDLRSPLVTVKTFLGFLESDVAGGRQDQVAQDLQFIHGAADKMKLLLDELLEMSRADRVETPPERVGLMDVIADVLASLAGLITGSNASVRLPEGDLQLFVDRPRLHQILQNLVENAVKYCGDDTLPQVEIGFRTQGGETVIFVRDNGIGIDPRYQDRIFGLFEKLDSGTPGAGLGLSLVRSIVDKSGGRVWVESEGGGQGACFCFTMPRAVVQD